MAEQIGELISALQYIHFDLTVIGTALFLILFCKDCHGNSSGIIKALGELKETIWHKN